jgi:hypothetical protein
VVSYDQAHALYDQAHAPKNPDPPNNKHCYHYLPALLDFKVTLAIWLVLVFGFKTIGYGYGHQPLIPFRQAGRMTEY